MVEDTDVELQEDPGPCCGDDWDQCEMATRPFSWWYGIGLYIKRTAIISAVGLALASQAAQLLQVTGVIK